MLKGFWNGVIQGFRIFRVSGICKSLETGERRRVFGGFGFCFPVYGFMVYLNFFRYIRRSGFSESFRYAQVVELGVWGRKTGVSICWRCVLAKCVV